MRASVLKTFWRAVGKCVKTAVSDFNSLSRIARLQQPLPAKKCLAALQVPLFVASNRPLAKSSEKHGTILGTPRIRLRDSSAFQLSNPFSIGAAL